MARLSHVLLCVSALACATPRTRYPEQGYAETLAVTLENDLVVGNDDGYTNGIGFTWVSRNLESYPADSFARRMAEWGSFLPFVGDSERRTFAAFTFAQEMFTPEDVTLSTPDPTDQPYAGLLFIEPAWYAQDDKTSHVWSLRFGTVGPDSLADGAQRAVHELIGSDLSAGWDAQIPNELFFNVDYTVAVEAAGGGSASQQTWRLVPVGTAGVGTYFTGVGAAMYGEVGWNLPETVGSLNVRRGLDPFSALQAGGRDGFSLSFYLGGGGFAVGHYLPLDGTVFRDSPSVESEPFVGFLTAGATLRFDHLSIGLLLSSLSDTFEGQTSDEDFGTLAVAWSL